MVKVLQAVDNIGPGSNNPGPGVDNAGCRSHILCLKLMSEEKEPQKQTAQYLSLTLFGKRFHF